MSSQSVRILQQYSLAIASNVSRNAANFFAWNQSVYPIPEHDADVVALACGKEMWTGFFTSTHVASGGKTLLNMDGCCLAPIPVSYQ